MTFRSLPLISVQMLSDRCGEPITDDVDERMAVVIINQVSARARFIGAPWPDPILAPDIVKAVVLECCARIFLNPEGYALERGDEVTFQRSRGFDGNKVFDDADIAMLRAAAGKSGIASVKLVREVTPGPSVAQTLRPRK